MTTDLRTRILDAAIKLLETEGSKAFGQTRIARAAGVKQGNITYHFPKKADLVAAVVERVNERRLADLQDLGERADKIEPEELRAALFERLASMATEIKRSRVMLALLIEAEHDPEISKLMSAVTSKQRVVLATLLRREPGDLELELVLALLSGLSLHVLGSEASGASSDRIEALLRRFHRWLPILLTPTGAPAATPSAQASSAATPSAPRSSARAPSTHASSAKATSTQASSARTPSTQASSARAPSTQASSARTPSTQASSTTTTSTQAPSARAPSTRTSSARAPSTQTPSARAPSTRTSSARAPSTQTPSAKPPSARASSATALSARTPSARRRSAPRGPSRPVRASPT